MKEQFDNKLISSFALWLDNRIVDEGEAFKNYTGLLYQQNDPSAALRTYTSPYKSWVYDSCTEGANVPSGFYNSSGQFLTRESGLFFDFINGRVLSSGNWGAALSGEYSNKEYNIYFSTEEVTNFYLESALGANKDLSYTATGAQPYKFNAPCAIITNAYGENVPFAFGGQDTSKRILRLYVISDNNYKQEAFNSLVIDAARANFPLVDNIDVPINSYGDLKTGYYNYCEVKQKYGCKGVYISNIYSYKIGEKLNRSSNLSLSFFEVEVEAVRYPRG